MTLTWHSFAHLNIARLIFVSIFLFGMIFTVVRYIPLEEELPTSKIELCKKQTESTDGGEGEDTETEQDDLFDIPHPAYFSSAATPPARGAWWHTPYVREWTGITTPPPKA